MYVTQIRYDLCTFVITTDQNYMLLSDRPYVMYDTDTDTYTNGNLNQVDWHRFCKQNELYDRMIAKMMKEVMEEVEVVCENY